MIKLTRLNGHSLLLNSDLIEFIENAPDTVITLVNGEKVIVRETTGQILERVVEFRSRLLDGLRVKQSRSSDQAGSPDVIQFGSRTSEAI